MKHIKKLVVITLAVMMTLTIGSLAVFAAPSDASNTYKVEKVEVSGIKDGNTLKLYKVVQFNLDPATNEFNYTLATGLPAAYDSIDELAALIPDGYSLADAGSTIRVAADTLANGIANNTITPIGSAVTATAGSGDKATISNLPAGWYVAVVSGTADTGVVYQNMLINALPVPDTDTNSYKAGANVSFEVKHIDETVEKEVAGGESTDEYSVGDKVPFKITTTIPNYPNPAKYAVFKITDTPSDLTDIIDETGADKMTVKVDGTEVARGASTYTVTQSGDGFVITFAKDYILANPGKPVEVSYKATIKESASIANDGLTAENTAKITFNPNPNEDGVAEPEDTTKVYTYGVTVLKHEANDESKALKGAKFILYAEDGTTVVRPETPVNNDGKLSWDGLGAGTYKLVETVAPVGYKLDSTPRTITISEDTATGDDPLKDGTQTYVLESKVPNTPGTTLPSTGGIGTIIFYTLGTILVLGCGIVLISRRRMNNNR